MYPRSREEVIAHAQMIRDGILGDRIFDSIGPFVVYSENFEGGAVIQTQPQEEQPGQYHGYGTSRLEILKEHLSGPFELDLGSRKPIYRHK